MNLIDMNNNDLIEVNGGFAFVPIIVGGIKVVAAIGAVAEGINLTGDAYDSFKAGHKSFKH